MTGRNMHVYFQEETFSKIKSLIPKREISRFINEAVEEKLHQKQRQNQEQLKIQLIKGYQAVAQSQKRKAEDEIWDETSSDGLK